MVIELFKYATDTVAKLKDEDSNIYNIGLGVDSLTKTDSELEELAIEKYNAIKFREANPLPPTYQELRAKEYPSTDELIVALWELVVEKRPETANELQVKREAVRQKYPKT